MKPLHVLFYFVFQVISRFRWKSFLKYPIFVIDKSSDAKSGRFLIQKLQIFHRKFKYLFFIYIIIDILWIKFKKITIQNFLAWICMNFEFCPCVDFVNVSFYFRCPTTTVCPWLPRWARRRTVKPGIHLTEQDQDQQPRLSIAQEPSGKLGKSTKLSWSH